MADGSRRGRDVAFGLVGAVTAGAVSASLGGLAALADEPEYPSWQRVQAAKTDERETAKESDRIAGLLIGLQSDADADAAGRTAAIAAERFHRARALEDEARARRTALAAQADAAQAAARTSRMRAGLLAASVARRGTDPSLTMLLDAGGADDLLRQLATVSQLSAQTQAIYAKAVADQRQAEAVGAQADSAATVLAARADAAQDAMGAAQRAAVAATEAVASQQRHADRLLSQLADLRRTSVRLAAAYVDQERERAEAARPVPAAAPSVAPASAAVSEPVASDAPAAEAAAPSGAPSDRATPAPPPPVEPAPAPAPFAGPPNSAQAASAVAFARDQVGDAYRLGGSGPSSWDCSGLTMQAYASIGLGIGGHSATAQYRLAAEQGRLAPYAQAQVGDLIFYTDGGGDMYHVALSSGGGRMIEAPYPGVPVREVAVRSADLFAQVARPTG